LAVSSVLNCGYDVLNTSEQSTGKEVDIGRRKDKRWIFSTELDTGRDHHFRCCRSDLLPDRFTSDDLDLAYEATISEYSQVICLTSSFLVTVSARSGRQITSCTMSSSIPQARRQALIPPIYHVEDHATCSEHLTTIVFPANNAARIGEMRLWKE
jgi:hypothetical protein